MYWELKIGIAALAFPFHSPWGPLQADAFGKKLLRNTFLFMVLPSVCKPTGHTIKTKGVDFSTPSCLLIGLRKLGIEHRYARLSLPLAVGAYASRSFGKKLLRTDFCRAFRLDTASPSFAKEGWGRILGMTK